MPLKGESRNIDRADAKALARGDRATLERLYAAMAPSMVRFALTSTATGRPPRIWYGGAWLTVFHKAGQFNGAASLRSRIFAILGNKAPTTDFYCNNARREFGDILDGRLPPHRSTQNHSVA